MIPKWRWPIGKFRGVLITRTPPGYLVWAINNMEPHYSDKARAELARRQTYEPNIEVTGHALNRASQRILHVWQSEKTEDGLYTWLAKKAEAALHAQPQGPFPKNYQVTHNGIVYAFKMKYVIPVLASVWVEGQHE